MGSDRYWESQNNGSLWYQNVRRKALGLHDDWIEKARKLNAASPLEAAGIRQCARDLKALLDADAEEKR
jgi:hypothetical protein